MRPSVIADWSLVAPCKPYRCPCGETDPEKYYARRKTKCRACITRDNMATRDHAANRARVAAWRAAKRPPDGALSGVLCECGCGDDSGLRQSTPRMGQPRRFKKGHGRRLSAYFARDGWKKCRVCQVPKPVSEYHVNRDKSDGYARACKECRARESAARYAADPDAVANSVRRSAQADPERHNANRRKHVQARRARRRDAFIEHVDPRIVYQMHGGRCGICGEFIEGAFHVDHVIPLGRDGKHGYINVQPAHPACNMRKGTRA